MKKEYGCLQSLSDLGLIASRKELGPKVLVAGTKLATLQATACPFLTEVCPLSCFARASGAIGGPSVGY